MTVVNPKSISGINSITMASGSDNLLTIHSNNTTERVRVDSSGNLTATSFSGDGSSLTGVASTENIRTNTNATFLQNVTVVGTSTVTGNIVPSSDSATDIGTNSVRFQNAYVDTYYGDGSNLTGISAGVSLANGADNRVVTATGAAALNGESGVTYDGTDFTIGSGRISLTDESSGAQFKLGTGSDFQIEHDGSNSYIYNLTNDLLIQCDNNVEITAKTGGTKRFRFDSDGLKFGSDTAAANALDDYEEGTFTPTARGNNTNSSPLIEGTGKYTKIGRLVQITLSFSAENGSYLPGGEYIQIHGLPFITDGTHYVNGPGMNYKVVFNSSYQYYWYIPNNGTIMWGYRNVSDSSYQPWGTDEFDNTQWYHNNTFTYMTDT